MLDFLAEQQNRIIAEVRALRDDRTVDAAIIRRIDSNMGHLDAILTAILDAAARLRKAAP
jgi:hypothetical protein